MGATPRHTWQRFAEMVESAKSDKQWEQVEALAFIAFELAYQARTAEELRHQIEVIGALVESYFARGRFECAERAVRCMADLAHQGMVRYGQSAELGVPFEDLQFAAFGMMHDIADARQYDVQKLDELFGGMIEEMMLLS